MNHRDLPDVGLVPHHILDQLHTLFTTGQLRLQVATPDVSNPPTDAELVVTEGNPGTAIPGPSAPRPKSAPASSARRRQRRWHCPLPHRLRQLQLVALHR